MFPCWLLPFLHHPVLRLHSHAYEIPLEVWTL